MYTYKLILAVIEVVDSLANVEIKDTDGIDLFNFR